MHVDDCEVERVASLDERKCFGSRRERLATQSPCLGLQVENAAVDGVVVDDQHPLAGEFRGDARRGPSRRHVGGGRGDGEVERDARRVARIALHPHRAAHQLGEALADGKTEAGAAVLAGRRRIELAELLEQLVSTVGRDADAGVAYGEMQLAFVVAGAGFERQHHLAGFGELHRVAQQVHEDLTQTGHVTLHADGHGGIDEERQLQTLSGRGFADEIERRLNACPQIKWMLFELETAGIDLGEVEDVVDDA